MSAEAPILDKPLPGSLARLVELLQDGAHLLIVGDESISQAALLATKQIFDLALACEPLSHPHLHPFLASILETPAPTLRSSTLAKTMGKQPSPPPAPAPEEVLPYTPLGELTVEGMEPEQVWQQLELRSEGIGKVVKEVGAGEGNDEDEDEEGEGSSDEDEDGWEDGSDEEMTIEEFKRMMAEQGIDDEDEEGSGGDSEDEDEEGFRLRDEMSDGDDDEREEEEEEEDEEGEDEDEDEEEVSDEDEEDEGDEEDEYDQLEMDGLDVDMGSDEEDDDDAGSAEDDQGEDANDDLPGPSRRHRHPTLDDEFFSIDDFNRMTEEAEAGRLSSGRLGGEDDDDDGDIADIGSMMLSGREEEEGIMYTDFFDAPKRAGPVNGQGKGKGKSKSKAEKGKGERKGKGKGVRFGEEEEDAEMNDEDDEDDKDDEEEDAGRGVMGRVKGDLFDDDEEEQEEQILSTHEKQQLALAKQIAELEGQAIGPKDWTLLGEASSRARPENSLLEEDLDFEQVGKVVPVITDEVVQSLEEMIKKRIIDNNFDSTVRVRAYEPTPFLPSRYFELQDTQSSKSLAQIYEEEYQAAAAGGKVVDARDEKLKKEHEEIDKIWSEICYKLDALSSLNFVPKQPKASITTITNLPTTSMESALPPTSASTTLLAPEELFNPPTAPSLVARSELTPEEAQRARQRARKVKQSRNRKLGDMAELYGKKKGAKAEKEEALKNLVKGGKGVTVVGKGDKEAGKARKRQGGDGEGEREDGKRLKLAVLPRRKAPASSVSSTTTPSDRPLLRAPQPRPHSFPHSSTHPASSSHVHHHHRSRPRSVSRTSSSPSPPPLPVSPRSSSLAFPREAREKRRSFTAPRTPRSARAHLGTGNSLRLDHPAGESSTRSHSGPGSDSVNGAGRAGGTAGTGSTGSTGWSYGYPDESPVNGLNGDDRGWSTQYGASASSPGGGSEEERGENYFVSARGDETEVELEREGSSALGTGTSAQANLGSLGSLGLSEMRKSGTPKISPPLPVPLPPSRGSVAGRRAATRETHLASPIPTLLPIRIGLSGHDRTDAKGKGRGWLGFRLTRRRCEDGLLLGAVMLGVWKLGAEWEERALAGEITLLVGLSIIYVTFRVRPSPPRSPVSSSHGRPQSPLVASFALAQSTGHSQVRERAPRMSTSHGTSGFMASSPSGMRDELRTAQATAGEEDEVFGVGARGCVWGTAGREYRDCLDDGILFALLLAPLVASALLHGALSTLAADPTVATPKGWIIESPLVLASTPIRQLPESRARQALQASDAIRALSALVTSRRNLVQLFTLCSFVLLVHLAWSLRLEVRLIKRASQPPETPASSTMERDSSEPRHATGGSSAMSSSPNPTAVSGTYWLRRGEWRRTKSVVGFSFLVTGGCVVVKIVTALIGRGVWSDMSPSDIVIATLFYQFSIYVCVRLARRGFTLGELAVVCNAATALLMETVNMTRMNIRILRIPYIKTYRLPTPLLTFQLALIPGSLLAGFLLSPLLYLSRHLAQRPAHRLRFPHEKPIHRRLLALGFYAGAALVCGGLVGTWTKWCLDWRDPFAWVVLWLLEGRRAWTRPALISYWGALAAISVAGWSRQLSRARRHRRYVVPGVRESGSSAHSHGNAHGHGHGHGHGQGHGHAHGHGHNAPSQAGATHSHDGGDVSGLSGVASQMMDAADQRMPTLSVNARRKFFHALAVVMFVPGIAVDPAFTHLSFSVAFAAFTFAEYIRYFALWPFGVSVHLFLNEFLDSKDSGTAILSHFYLLAGCASPLWLEGPSEILAYFGVLSLGVGDALASIVGRRVGKVRWSAAGGKTVEGSVAFLGSVLVSTIFLWAFGAVGNFRPVPYVVATALATLLEAFSAQNDNLILPMYGWAVGTLLGV